MFKFLFQSIFFDQHVGKIPNIISFFYNIFYYINKRKEIIFKGKGKNNFLIDFNNLFEEFYVDFSKLNNLFVFSKTKSQVTYVFNFFKKLIIVFFYLLKFFIYNFIILILFNYYYFYHILLYYWDFFGIIKNSSLFNNILLLIIKDNLLLVSEIFYFFNNLFFYLLFFFTIYIILKLSFVLFFSKLSLKFNISMENNFLKYKYNFFFSFFIYFFISFLLFFNLYFNIHWFNIEISSVYNHILIGFVCFFIYIMIVSAFIRFYYETFFYIIINIFKIFNIYLVETCVNTMLLITFNGFTFNLVGLVIKNSLNLFVESEFYDLINNIIINITDKIDKFFSIYAAEEFTNFEYGNHSMKSRFLYNKRDVDNFLWTMQHKRLNKMNIELKGQSFNFSKGQSFDFSKDKMNFVNKTVKIKMELNDYNFLLSSANFVNETNKINFVNETNKINFVNKANKYLYYYGYNILRDEGENCSNLLYLLKEPIEKFENIIGAKYNKVLFSKIVKNSQSFVDFKLKEIMENDFSDKNSKLNLVKELRLNLEELQKLKTCELAEKDEMNFLSKLGMDLILMKIGLVNKGGLSNEKHYNSVVDSFYDDFYINLNKKYSLKKDLTLMKCYEIINGRNEKKWFYYENGIHSSIVNKYTLFDYSQDLYLEILKMNNKTTAIDLTLDAMYNGNIYLQIKNLIFTIYYPVKKNADILDDMNNIIEKNNNLTNFNNLYNSYILYNLLLNHNELLYFSISNCELNSFFFNNKENFLIKIITNMKNTLDLLNKNIKLNENILYKERSFNTIQYEEILEHVNKNLVPFNNSKKKICNFLKQPLYSHMWLFYSLVMSDTENIKDEVILMNQSIQDISNYLLKIKRIKNMADFSKPINESGPHFLQYCLSHEEILEEYLNEDEKKKYYNLMKFLYFKTMDKINLGLKSINLEVSYYFHKNEEEEFKKLQNWDIELVSIKNSFIKLSKKPIYLSINNTVENLNYSLKELKNKIALNQPLVKKLITNPRDSDQIDPRDILFLFEMIKDEIKTSNNLNFSNVEACIALVDEQFVSIKKKNNEKFSKLLKASERFTAFSEDYDLKEFTIICLKDFFDKNMELTNINIILSKCYTQYMDLFNILAQIDNLLTGEDKNIFFSKKFKDRMFQLQTGYYNHCKMNLEMNKAFITILKGKYFINNKDRNFYSAQCDAILTQINKFESSNILFKNDINCHTSNKINKNFKFEIIHNKIFTKCVYNCYLNDNFYNPLLKNKEIIDRIFFVHICDKYNEARKFYLFINNDFQKMKFLYKSYIDIYNSYEDIKKQFRNYTNEHEKDIPIFRFFLNYFKYLDRYFANGKRKMTELDYINRRWAESIFKNLYLIKLSSKIIELQEGSIIRINNKEYIKHNNTEDQNNRMRADKEGEDYLTILYNSFEKSFLEEDLKIGVINLIENEIILEPLNDLEITQLLTTSDVSNIKSEAEK
jgi:hypothetical protein